jgi:arsenite methyltransferase
MNDNEIKKNVRETYGSIAKSGSSCCGSSCGCSGGSQITNISKNLGYHDKELNAVPDGSDLGLGCGNPTAFAMLKEGDTVLDLGSGAGIDCFIAAKTVGSSGKVIGVDMTPEMIVRARENALKSGYSNVEFRLGEIEHLPVDADSVDVIISNCVINLVPDKSKAFLEAFRVLRPGGRLSVSDIVLNAPLPEWVHAMKDAYSACITGAELKNRYLEQIKDAGFEKIEILSEKKFSADIIANVESRGGITESAREAAELVLSISVSAIKPL